MDKKLLVVYYSQTGQLEEIVNAFCGPILAGGVQVEFCKIRPKQDFPFPWTSPQFFDAMPESVLEIPLELEPVAFKSGRYDLIVFAYQPWFLSPSIPATSLLALPAFQQIAKGTPVVTLIGARNMWVSAQEKIKKQLISLGSPLVGNIAVVDRHQNHVSAVTILYWMLTGKKDRCLGIFPIPGIAPKDIVGTATFGNTVLSFLQKGEWGDFQRTLMDQKAVEIDADLLFVEQTGSRLFAIWAKLIKKKTNRAPWLVAFKYYLLIALFLVAPVVLLIRNLLFRPFLGKQIQKKKQHYLGLD